MKNITRLIILISFIVVATIIIKVSYFFLNFQESLGEPIATTYLDGKQVIQKKYGVLVLTDFGSPVLVRGDYEFVKRGFHVDKQAFCSRKSEFCIEDKQIHIYETPGSVLKVNTYPSNNDYLFDKLSGNLLSCINCKDVGYFDQILKSTFHWSSDGNQAIVINSSDWFNKQYGQVYPVPGGDKNYNSKIYNIWLLDFLSTGVKVTDISPTEHEYKYGEPLDTVYSPNYSFIAWHLCDPKCNLWRYNIINQTYSSVAYPCTSEQYNNRWNIVWDSDVPRTEYDWGAQNREKCFKADGTPAFPSQVRP